MTKKIKLNFKRVAEEKLVAFTAATMGEEVPPTHGDIPETREELEKEMARLVVFRGRVDHRQMKAALENAQSWKVREELKAKIAEINGNNANRTLFGFGGLKRSTREELQKLQGELDAFNSRRQANLEYLEQSNETCVKLLERLGKMEVALAKCSAPVAVKPAAKEPAAKKISLNFKRVTGAQSEAMAEGTLVTGGFNLPEHKERRRRLQATIEAAERAERRMRAEKEEEEYRRREAEYRRREEEERERRAQDAARRQAAEEFQRMNREAERCRSRDGGGAYSSGGPAPRASGRGGSSIGSGW